MEQNNTQSQTSLKHVTRHMSVGEVIDLFILPGKAKTLRKTFDGKY